MASTPTTRILQRVADGDHAAQEELFPIVYQELHAIAHRIMRRERRDHTLQTTALIHEAWVRLVGSADPSYRDRTHFVNVAARAMRRVLVDHARARKTLKRDATRSVPLVEDALMYWEKQHTDLLALDEALTRLGENDERMLKVVELCFFGGLTHGEAAAVLGLSERQVQLSWTMARGWLRRDLQRDERDG